MIDRNLVRGLVLAALALGFGLGAFRYPIRDFAHAGPGLFPLLVSSLLGIVAVVTIVRARFVAPEPLAFKPRNIALLMAALCSFALASKLLHNMVAGIVLMTFIAGFAASSRSWRRDLKVAAGLVAIAFGFQQLLHLNLPLY